MNVVLNIQNEICSVEAEIAGEKHAIKHCLNDSEQLWEKTVKLCELIARLGHLQKNLNGLQRS